MIRSDRCMELKQIKEEIHALPEIQETLAKFQENWFRPLHQNNAHFPFIKGLDRQTKTELIQHLAFLQPHLQVLSDSQILPDRLHHHAHNLVELKLTTFNGDRKKAKMLVNDLGHKESWIKRTLAQVNNLHTSLLHLSQQYEEVNRLLEKKLSLEEMVYYMSLPHRKYLGTLLKTADHHQKIVRDLSHHFMSISEELQQRKNLSR